MVNLTSIWKNRKIRLIALFGVISVIILFFMIIFRETNIGVIQVDTVIEGLILFPFLCLIFYVIFNSIKVTSLSPKDNQISSIAPQLKHKEKYQYVAFVSFMWFSYGFGIHLSANAIDEFIYGDRNYRDDLPNDLVDIIHLYDEIVGHAVLFSGLIGMFWALILKEIKYPQKVQELTKSEKLSHFALGSGFGLVMGFYFIEATYFIFPMMIYGGLTGVCLIYYLRSRKIKISQVEYTTMLIYSHFSFILAAIIYYLIHGSLTPPSEIYGF